MFHKAEISRRPEIGKRKSGRCGPLVCFKACFPAGASVNTEDETPEASADQSKCSSIIQADAAEILEGRFEETESGILESGADVNQTNLTEDDGDDPTLIHAVKNGHVNDAVRLLNTGADAKQINCTTGSDGERK